VRVFRGAAKGQLLLLYFAGLRNAIAEIFL
jgi:hypothetical protein